VFKCCFLCATPYYPTGYVFFEKTRFETLVGQGL